MTGLAWRKNHFPSFLPLATTVGIFVNPPWLAQNWDNLLCPLLFWRCSHRDSSYNAWHPIYPRSIDTTTHNFFGWILSMAGVWQAFVGKYLLGAIASCWKHAGGCRGGAGGRVKWVSLWDCSRGDWSGSSFQLFRWQRSARLVCRVGGADCIVEEGGRVNGGILCEDFLISLW